jgi:anti-sigma regulatory factor (Ser/Thr protein kinase)
MPALLSNLLRVFRAAVLTVALFTAIGLYGQTTEELRTSYARASTPYNKLLASYRLVNHFIERNDCDSANIRMKTLKKPEPGANVFSHVQKMLLVCAMSSLEMKCKNNVPAAENYLKQLPAVENNESEVAIFVHYAKADLYELMEDHEKAYSELEEVYSLSADRRDTGSMIKSAFGLARNSALLNARFDNKKYIDVCMNLARQTRRANHLAMAYRALGFYYTAPRKLIPDDFIANRTKYIDSSNAALKKSLSYLNEHEYQNRIIIYRILISNYVYLKNSPEVEIYLLKSEALLPLVNKRLQSQFYKVKGFYLTSIKKYKEGIAFYKKSIALSNEVFGSLKTNSETYLLIALAYEELKDFKNAYYSQVERELLLDSLSNIKLRKKTEAIDQGFRLLLSQKENALLKVHNENNDRLLREKNRFLGVLFILILLIISFIVLVLRNYLKEKDHVKTLDDLNKKLSQQHLKIFEINRLLQLKVLRTQMNPHFIYNCLNSIISLLMKEKQEEASGYILKLSKLLRMILDFSDKQNVDLEEEINFLELYLTMESMRFGSDFKYHVLAEETLLEDDISVPSLIIQPFVENAIWHGLLNKEGNKNLTIRFYLSPGQDKLCCSIEDNGIGRKQSGSVDKKHHGDTRHESKGIKITQERIEMLTYQAKNISVKIIDKQTDDPFDMGTLVLLELPLNEI